MEEVKVRKPLTAETWENILTLVLWLLVCLSLMVGMLIFASRKTIVITDSSGDSVSLENGPDCGNAAQQELKFRMSYEQEQGFVLPLSVPIKAENVVIENRYESRELWIYINGVLPEHFLNAEIAGKTSVVDYGHVEGWESGSLLKLHMNDIYEYRSTLSDTQLTIAYYEPHELYQTVVVVDAVAGGKDKGVSFGALTESEISLQVIQQLQQIFNHEQIKIYYTRRGDTDVSVEERAKLAEAVKADAFLSVGVAAADDVESYGITGYYNNVYFIPVYGNPQVADALTRNVTIAASNKALGLFPAGEDSVLQLLTMPAAQIHVGNMRNEQEYALLKQEAYSKKLAQGIQAAVMEIHDKLHQKEK